MATSKTAAQVASQVVAQAINYEVDTTDYVGTTITHAMIVVGTDKDSFTANESLKVEGMINIIFTAFNPNNPDNTTVTGGFHLSKKEAAELQAIVQKQLAIKKGLGYNPNTLVFSFESLPGRFIPDGKGGATMKWFTGINLSSFKFFIKMEGPAQVGTSEEEGQESAHENYRRNAVAQQYMKRASELAKQVSNEAQPKVRKSAHELLAEALNAGRIGQ